MPKIFISYRREDGAHQADRIHAALKKVVRDPKRNIFIDIDGIPAGVNFVQYLDDKVSQCNILLALIGPDWLGSLNSQTGSRRLDDPKDFVRIEIASALNRGVQVAPVLLDGASMPSEAELPDALKPLAFQNGVEVRRTSFDSDVRRMIQKLELRRGGVAATKPIALEAATGRPKSRRAVLGLVLGVAVIILAAASWAAYRSTTVAPTNMASSARIGSLDEFRAIGEAAGQKTDLLVRQNSQEVALADQQRSARRANDMVGLTMRAAREEPPKLIPEALTYARGQILGDPLNASTLSILSVAAPAAKGDDKLVISGAIADWRDQLSPEDWAKGDPELSEHAAQLAASPSGDAALGHVLLASIAFRRSQAAGPKSVWNRGCFDVVEQLQLADKAGLMALVQASGGEKGAGLNLLFWRAKCLRKHAEPREANALYRSLLNNPALNNLDDANALKVQAYHGYGTTLISLANDPSTPAAVANQMRSEAEESLEKVSALLQSAGAYEASGFFSAENAGFLLLQDEAPDKLVQALDHTQHIDASYASTWNLVIQLAAATGLYRDPAMLTKYSKEKLRRIIFDTYAKLAWQGTGTLDVEELATLLGPNYQQPLIDAADCAEHPDNCYEAHAKAWK